MKTVVEVLTSTDRAFRQRGIPSPRLDAELIIGHILNMDRVKVYLNHDRPLIESELEQLRLAVKRRMAREPLAWIIGRREFYGRDFDVGPGVLVPRPDTETLIVAALEWIGVPDAGGDAIFVADIGSGSGCIGLTLAMERPQIKVYAVDLSPEAIATTRANIERHGMGQRVGVLKGALLQPIPAGRVIDWVVSNPPYIPTADIEGLAPEVREQEPRLALDGGGDGLAVYRQLIPQAAGRVRRGVLVEVGIGQAVAVAVMMRDVGLTGVETVRDLSGVERVVRGRTAA